MPPAKPPATPTDSLLTPQDVASYLRLTVKTLALWRYKGTGPKFMRLGGSIRYAQSDVDRWLDAQRTAASA